MRRVPHKGEVQFDPKAKHVFGDTYVPTSNGVPIRSREMAYSQIEDLKALLAAQVESAPCGFDHTVDLGGADFATPGIILAKCLKCGAEFSFPAPHFKERQIGLSDMQTEMVEHETRLLRHAIQATRLLNVMKTHKPTKQTRCVRHKTKGCTSVLCR